MGLWQRPRFTYRISNALGPRENVYLDVQDHGMFLGPKVSIQYHMWVRALPFNKTLQEYDDELTTTTLFKLPSFVMEVRHKLLQLFHKMPCVAVLVVGFRTKSHVSFQKSQHFGTKVPNLLRTCCSVGLAKGLPYEAVLCGGEKLVYIQCVHMGHNITKQFFVITNITKQFLSHLQTKVENMMGKDSRHPCKQATLKA